MCLYIIVMHVSRYDDMHDLEGKNALQVGNEEDKTAKASVYHVSVDDYTMLS